MAQAIMARFNEQLEDLDRPGNKALKAAFLKASRRSDHTEPRSQAESAILPKLPVALRLLAEARANEAHLAWQMKYPLAAVYDRSYRLVIRDQS